MKKDNLEKTSRAFNTHEAAEQTLLEWIQTGLTLIGFGFALGSVIALMQAEHYEKSVVRAIRVIAALLIFVGILSITLALIQHKIKVKRIKNEEFHYRSSFNLSLFIGVLVSLLGVAAFLAILIHLTL